MTKMSLVVSPQLFFVPFTALWEGFVFSKLWLWFVVPLGAPAIGTRHAVGLSLLIGFATHQALSRLKDTREGLDLFANWLAQAIVVPAWALVLGFFFHLWLSAGAA